MEFFNILRLAVSLRHLRYRSYPTSDYEFFYIIPGDSLGHNQDQIASSSRKESEGSDDTATGSPGSSSDSSSTSTGEHVRERKRRLSTNSDDDEQGLNGDLNGNDLVKVTQRSPKGNGENGQEAKKIKLDDQTSKNRNEVRIILFTDLNKHG